MVVNAIKFMMCGVSMALTALFAFTFTGLSVDGSQYWTALDWLSIILLIAVGICIDSGKYLFWSCHCRSAGFSTLSLFLALFSWMASVAFFLTAESVQMAEERQSSPEYVAHMARISSLRQEIQNRQQLVEHRLNSRYHQQWKAGEEQLEIIAEKQNVLDDLLAKSSEIGVSQSLESMPSQQLFVSVGQLTGTRTPTVRIAFFALLAFFIESSSLAAISLSRPVTNAEDTREEPPLHKASPSNIVEAAKRARLIGDIVHGRTEPVLRKIKTGGYDLSLSAIKSVLSELYQQGILEDDIRNSYKLADLNTPNAAPPIDAP